MDDRRETDHDEEHDVPGEPSRLGVVDLERSLLSNLCSKITTAPWSTIVNVDREKEEKKERHARVRSTLMKLT